MLTKELLLRAARCASNYGYSELAIELRLAAKELPASEAENYRANWFKSNTGRDCQVVRVTPAVVLRP